MDETLNPETTPSEPEGTPTAATEPEETSPEGTTEATEAPTGESTEVATEGATGESTEGATEASTGESTEAVTGETIEESTGDTTAYTEVPGPGPTPGPFNWLSWSLMGLSLALIITSVVLAILLGKSKKSKDGTRRRKQKVTAPPPAASGDAPLTIGKLHKLGDRSSQQDCFAVSPENLASTHGLLAVVADGMGGLADGDKVSQTVVGTMLNGFMTVMGDPDSILLSLTLQANQAVNQLLGPGKIGNSGSTLVAGIIRNSKFHYVSVGDSRICLYRGGRLIQLNREHIYKNDLTVDAINGIGLLHEAATNRNAGGLTSYLGMGQLKYVDIPAQAVQTEPGDKFILMTDGVYNALTEEEICRALNAPAQQAADALGKMIQDKAYAHQDNYTAVILSC